MKKLRYAFIIIFGLFFFSIFLAASVRNVYMSKDGGVGRLGFLAKPIKFMAETPALIKKYLDKPEFFVENNTAKGGFDYLIKNDTVVYPKLLLSYKDKPFNQVFQLLDINNGAVLKEWNPDNKSLYEAAYNEDNPRKPEKGSDLYFMHPLMDSDSSLIINSQLTSLLVKLDKNSNPIWIKNDRIYHHTIETDDTNNLYVCTMPFESGKYDFLPGDYETYKSTLLDDHITILDKNGNEKFSKSVIEILLENGYEDLLLYKGQVISDMIHLNDIQPALTSGAFWAKGDLLVSCRNISTVFLYRPSANKIIWLRHGPWMNQHDVDFHGDNEIVVFGNDIIREESTIDPRITPANLSFSKKRPHNEVYLYNFAKDSIYTPYTAFLAKEKVRTLTSGRCDILPNGDLFFEETNQGRIIIGDTINKKIEFVKRLDEEHVSSLFWSRIIN